MSEPCPVLRLRQQDSVAVGPQERTYICGDLDRGLATETVEVDGELRQMCPRCAGEFVKEFHAQHLATERSADATKLHSVADYHRVLARTFGHRPAVARWFTDCAASIEAMAADVIEGKL